jgi:hypothetical protein
VNMFLINYKACGKPAGMDYIRDASYDTIIYKPKNSSINRTGFFTLKRLFLLRVIVCITSAIPTMYLDKSLEKGVVHC